MALTGSLTETEPVDVVQLISMGRKSGVLRVVDGHERIEIHFRDGQVLDAAHGSQRGEEVVYDLFTRRAGRFTFEPGQVTAAKAVERSVESLILEGMRRMDHWNEIRRRLPDDRARPVLAADSAAGTEIALGPEEGHLLLLIDSRRTIADVVEESGLPRLAAYEALDALVASRVVRLEGSAPSSAMAGPEQPVGLVGAGLHAPNSTDGGRPATRGDVLEIIEALRAL